MASPVSGGDEADFAQVEAAFDDAEGVGFCDAQFRVQFDVIEGKGVALVIEAACDLFEGSEHVEAASGLEGAEGVEVCRVAVAVHFTDEVDEAVEFITLQRVPGVHVPGIDVDIVGTGIDVVVAAGEESSSVDACFDVGEGQKSAFVVDVAVHVMEAQRRDAEAFHFQCPVCYWPCKGSVGMGFQSQAVADACPKAQGGRIDAVEFCIEVAFLIGFRKVHGSVEFYAVADSRASEGSGRQGNVCHALRVEVHFHIHVIENMMAFQVEGLNLCIVQDEIHFEALAVPVEVRLAVFGIIFDFLWIDEVALHILIVADGEDRIVQRDAFQRGRFHSPGHDVPWIDLQRPCRHTEDRISLRIIPGKVRERHAAMDIRCDFLDRDRPAQHFLLRYGIIEDSGRAEARHFEEEQHDEEE